MDIKYQNRERLYTIEDLENLLEYVPYEIWLKDKEGRHVYINQKGANKLGLKKEDIIGKTDMEIRSKEFWEKCKLTDDQVIQEKKALFYEDEFDNYNYEKGAYTTILMKWDDKERTLTINERKGNYKGMLKNRKFNIILVEPGKGCGDEDSPTFDQSISYKGKQVNVKLLIHFPLVKLL